MTNKLWRRMKYACNLISFNFYFSGTLDEIDWAYMNTECFIVFVIVDNFCLPI